jgi:hypothetical protein
MMPFPFPRQPEVSLRTRILSLALLLVAACAPTDEPPAEMDDVEEIAEVEEPELSLADFAGTWQNVVTLVGVEDPVATTTNATATSEGWTMMLEGRPAVPLTPSIMGDSLVVVSESYESILRPGVMTTVRTATVIENGEQVGSVVVTYTGPDGDEQVRGTMRGTRTP